MRSQATFFLTATNRRDMFCSQIDSPMVRSSCGKWGRLFAICLFILYANQRMSEIALADRSNRLTWLGIASSHASENIFQQRHLIPASRLPASPCGRSVQPVLYRILSLLARVCGLVLGGSWIRSRFSGGFSYRDAELIWTSFFCLFGRICGSIPDKLWNSCFFCSFLRVSGHLKYGGQILNVPIWSISHPQWFGEPLRRRPRISPSPCRSGVMRGQRREGRNPSVEPERRSSW